MTQQRFVTFISVLEDEKIQCLTHDEFTTAKARGEHSSEDWDEWVWQFADSKEQAIAQHIEKMDEWHVNPDKETY